MQPHFIRESDMAKKKAEYGSALFLTADNSTAPACEIDGTPHPRTLA
jgi:hypothetical protein